MADLVSYSVEANTAVVHMDDGKANALGRPMLDALLAALTRAEAEARAIVLVGRPDRFCAGFDLRAMMSGHDVAIEQLRAGAELLMRLYASAVPLVVACTGHALAAGALVVLTGDLRIGAAGAYKIGLNEVAIGLPVPMLAMELARDRLAAAELARATLHAHIYDPATALAAGYLDAVVPADELRARAIAEAARLGALSPTAFRATKARLRGKTIAAVRAGLDADLRDLMTPR